MLTILMILRECLESTRNAIEDFSNPDFLKGLSPENCHICNTDTDMTSKQRCEFIENHRKIHSECYFNEDSEFKS